MSNFTPLVRKEYEFEGDTVKVSFSRMKRKHVLKLVPRLKGLKGKTDDEIADGFSLDLVDDLLDVLPKYVQSFEGLRDSNGDAIKFEDISEDVYFTDLFSSITLDLITESMPGGASKN